MRLFKKAQPKADHPALYDAQQSGPYSWCAFCGDLIEEGTKHVHSDFGLLAKAFLPLSQHTGLRYDPKLISIEYR